MPTCFAALAASFTTQTTHKNTKVPPFTPMFTPGEAQKSHRFMGIPGGSLLASPCSRWCDFEGNRPKVASKPENFSGLAGATVTGVSLLKSQVKVIHFMGTSPRRAWAPGAAASRGTAAAASSAAESWKAAAIREPRTRLSKLPHFGEQTTLLPEPHRSG